MSASSIASRTAGPKSSLAEIAGLSMFLCDGAGTVTLSSSSLDAGSLLVQQPMTMCDDLAWSFGSVAS